MIGPALLGTIALKFAGAGLIVTAQARLMRSANAAIATPLAQIGGGFFLAALGCLLWSMGV